MKVTVYTETFQGCNYADFVVILLFKKFSLSTFTYQDLLHREDIQSELKQVVANISKPSTEHVIL